MKLKSIIAILNATFISEMIKLNEFMGLIVIIFGLMVLDERVFKKFKIFSE